MNRSGFNIHIAVLDDCRGKFLDNGLRTPAFAPKQILPADILHLPPTFGPTDATIFLVHAGPDRDKMDLLAEHAFREWSLRGSVLITCFTLARS